jgi:polar amino acid transport system substrate-binding protein
MKYCSLIILISVIWFPAHASELKVCIEDISYIPFIDSNAEKLSDGLLVKLVDVSAGQNKLKVKLIRQSWPRCLSQVATGEVDALMGIIYTPDRSREMVFPKGADKPNPDMYLWKVRYPFFVKKGKNFSFNSIKKRLEFGIGTPYQYVTYQILAEQKLLPTYNYDVEAGLSMVAAGRLDAYVIETSIGLHHLAKLSLLEAVEPTEEALLESYWHVAFNPQYYATHAQNVDGLWRDLAVFRDSLQQSTKVESTSN